MTLNYADPRKTTTSRVPHIRDDIPEFNVPQYDHARYQDWVPDTLDIQERCALAVNGLTGATDPEREHLLYFRASFFANPPSMTHTDSDACQPKFMEALPLMRIASGSLLNDHVDPIWMATALRQIGPDGLIYWPTFPWASRAAWGAPAPPASHHCVPCFAGRTISAMTVYMLQDPDGPWASEIKRAVGALDSVSIRKDDYAYFPQGAFVPGAPRPKTAEMPIGIWASLAGWTAQGLSHFFRHSGYAAAGELAGRLARYIAYHSFYYGPNGEFLRDDPEPLPPQTPRPEHPFVPTNTEDTGPLLVNRIHFQHHMVPLLGILDYALAAGDRDLAAFARMSFEWAKTKGETTVGYFPENIGSQWFEGSETCQLAGMIGLALKLSAAGLGDYWDDADRWIRNQFAENQLRRADWVYRIHAGGRVYPHTTYPESQADGPHSTTDRVPERNVGAFASWPSANDFYVGRGRGIMHCCTGNGTRALYYVWEHMLTYADGELSVNLLMNRPSRWADVRSYVPHRGQVDVAVKRSCSVRIRIPEWVAPGQARCRVDGQARDLAWDGRYALVGAVSEGHTIELTFPISERVEDVHIQKQRYILTIRGNDVVDIDPPGRYGPYYERDHYREDATRWKQMERLVTDEKVYW